MASKILSVHWLTQAMQPFSFGIVTVETQEGRRKAYIGVIEGQSEMRDLQAIRDNGSPMPHFIFEEILKSLKEAPNLEP